VLLLALVPAAMHIPALSALAIVSAVCAVVVAAEAIGRREHRTRIRNAERGLAANEEPWGPATSVTA
jgi:hypothetical protein